MAISRKLQNAGVADGLASAIMGEIASGLTATGTTQATAFRINTDVAKFTNVAINTGAILPVSSRKTDVIEVINAGANALSLYPPLDEQIGSSSSNSSISVVAGSAVTLRKISDTGWDIVSNYLVSAGGGGGTIGGTLAATQVAFGSGSDEIAGSSSLTWGSSALTIGGSTSFSSTSESVLTFGQQLVGTDAIQWIPSNGLFFKHGAGGPSGDRIKITSGGYLGIGTTTPHSHLQVSGSQAIKTTNVSADYTITSDDYLIRVTSTAAARTITLPTAAGIAGRVYEIKDTSGGAGTNNITIDADGTETIDGAATATISAHYGSIKLASNGTNWDLINNTQNHNDGGSIPTTGLVLRYSAESLSSTLSNNDFVTSLAPDVGALTLTASGSDRPTFKTGISPSGSDVIWFTGGDRLNVTGLSGLPSTTQPGTIVCVVFGVQPIGASPSDHQHIVQYGSATALQARGLTVHRTNRWFTSSEVGMNLPAVSGPSGWGVKVLGHTYDGAVVSVLVDGEECASNVEVLNTGTDELAIGSAIGGAADQGAFYFMHLLIYDRVLTREDWRSIMSYARAEWGA